MAAIAEKWRPRFLAEGLKAMAEGGGDKVSSKARAGLVKTPDPVPHHDTRKELAALANVSERGPAIAWRGCGAQHCGIERPGRHCCDIAATSTATTEGHFGIVLLGKGGRLGEAPEG